MGLMLFGLLFLIALCCAAEAAGEEPMLGMGRRHYLGEGRLDITYTTELATPHVDWADPYLAPISAYVIPSDEEMMIARATARLVAEAGPGGPPSPGSGPGAAPPSG